MTQLADYRSAVRMLGYDGVSDATVDSAIQQARRRVTQDRRWSFMEDNDQTVSTVANTVSVSVAAVTDLQYIDAVRLLEGTDPLNLEWRSAQFVKDLHAEFPDNSGTPVYWAQRRASTLTFYPKPDRVLTVDMDYIVKVSDLVAGVDDVIPDQHQDLVTWAAVVPLAFRQRGAKEAASADSHYHDVLLPRHASQDGAEQRQTSRQVRSGYWG